MYKRQGESLLTGKYFDLARITLSAENMSVTLPSGETHTTSLELEFDSQTSPTVVMVIEGQGEICGRTVTTGMTGLIPASVQSINVMPTGSMTLLLATPK